MRMLAFLVPLVACPLAAASDLWVETGGERRALELRELEIRAEVDERIASTRVRQVFANDSDATLEGVYVFPVPPGAALTSFSMTIGDRRLSGAVVEKARAASIYESYVRRQVDPALLEHVERNVFRVRVFPIAPRSAVEIELGYREVLEYDHGECRYVYPLSTSSRPGAVAGRFLLALDVRSSVPIRSAATEGGLGEVVHRGDHACSVAFEAESVALDRDVTVRYRLAGDAPRLTWLAHRPDPAADGWFLLVLSPQEDLGRTRDPLDVVYVVDVSGSMQGAKIEQAARALRYSIGSLAPEDRFQIVAFSTAATRFAGGLVAADGEGRALAEDFIGRLVASGGTAIDEALQTGLAAVGAAEGRQRVVVFLTDGEPTIGERNRAKILERAAGRAAPGTRVHTFGIGTPADYDRDFLAALANAHGGGHVSVGSGDAIEVALAKFQDELAHPSIVDLSIDWGGAGVQDVHPLRLRPLVRGRQIQVLGRYRGTGRHKVVVTGRRGDAPVRLEADVDLAAAEPDHAGLAPVWAAGKIESLRFETYVGRPSAEVEQEIVRLALEHRLATPWTSFLVLESEAEYRRWNLEPGEEQRRPDAASPDIGDPLEENADGEARLNEYKDAMERAKNQAFAAMPDDQRLQEDLVSREQRIADLTEELEEYKSKIEHLRAQGIDVARLSETKVPAPLDAKIVAKHDGVGLVMLNLGEKHGVEKGMNFTIYRGDQYVGQVIVEEIFPDMASARIDTRFQKQEVREGDDLTTRIRDLPRARPPRTKGRVVAVDSANARVVIDLGAGDGLVPGTALTVYREGRTHVGRIVVEEVQPGRSIARLDLDTIREEIHEGDEVEVAGR